MSILEIKNLKKSFNNLHVLKDISLTLHKGKIYGLLGPNGSGKSTLMKIIAGLYQPTDGLITVNQNVLSTDTKNDIVFMTTENFLYETLTIEQIGNFYNDFYNDFDITYFNDLLLKMDLHKSLFVSKLSSGMEAKLKIAVSLSRDTMIYLLDEPLNGIDIIARKEIIECIINRASDDNIIVISSHLINEFENILDDVFFLKNGCMVLSGNAEDIRESRRKSIVEIYKEVYQND